MKPSYQLLRPRHQRAADLEVPGLRIETAPEYATASGELVQLIPDREMGYGVGNTVFTERLHFHRTEIRTLNYAQKLPAFTAGAVIKYLYGIAQMLGG